MPREQGLPLILAAMRFALWAAQREKPPTWREVQGFLGCTSNKARKWRRNYLKAKALPFHPHPAATGTTKQTETAP